MQDRELAYIGIVKSSLKSLDDCPLQESEHAPEASIIINAEYIEGIKDLKPGAKLVILTWLHKGDRSVVSCFPRRDYNAPKIGVFSTRSPDRPNPIGLHHVTVKSVSGNEIVVSELEVLDGTPILDIKPKI